MNNAEYLPPIGTKLRIGRSVFEVTVHNTGKRRFSAKFIGLIPESRLVGANGKPMETIQKPAVGRG